MEIYWGLNNYFKQLDLQQRGRRVLLCWGKECRLSGDNQGGEEWGWVSCRRGRWSPCWRGREAWAGGATPRTSHNLRYLDSSERDFLLERTEQTLRLWDCPSQRTLTDQLSTGQRCPPTNNVLIQTDIFDTSLYSDSRQSLMYTNYPVRLLLCTGLRDFLWLWPQTELNTRSLRNDQLSAPSKYWRQGRNSRSSAKEYFFTFLLVM